MSDDDERAGGGDEPMDDELEDIVDDEDEANPGSSPASPAHEGAEDDEELPEDPEPEGGDGAAATTRARTRTRRSGGAATPEIGTSAYNKKRTRCRVGHRTTSARSPGQRRAAQRLRRNSTKEWGTIDPVTIVVVEALAFVRQEGRSVRAVRQLHLVLKEAYENGAPLAPPARRQRHDQVARGGRRHVAVDALTKLTPYDHNNKHFDREERLAAARRLAGRRPRSAPPRSDRAGGGRERRRGVGEHQRGGAGKKARHWWASRSRSADRSKARSSPGRRRRRPPKPVRPLRPTARRRGGRPQRRHQPRRAPPPPRRRRRRQGAGQRDHAQWQGAQRRLGQDAVRGGRVRRQARPPSRRALRPAAAPNRPGGGAACAPRRQHGGPAAHGQGAHPDVHALGDRGDGDRVWHPRDGPARRHNQG